MWNNPNLINYTLMVLYVLAIGRWSIAGNGPQVAYWIGALILTIGITPGTAKFLPGG